MRRRGRLGGRGERQKRAQEERAKQEAEASTTGEGNESGGLIGERHGLLWEYTRRCRRGVVPS